MTPPVKPDFIFRQDNIEKACSGMLSYWLYCYSALWYIHPAVGTTITYPWYPTLFSKRSAHWFCPVVPVTLGHWSWPRVMTNLSNGFASNMQKITRGRWPRDLRKLGWFSCSLLLEKSLHVCVLFGYRQLYVNRKCNASFVFNLELHSMLHVSYLSKLK